MKTKQLTKYISDDGKEFDEEDECREYEAMLNAVGKYYKINTLNGIHGVACIEEVLDYGEGYFMRPRGVVAEDGIRHMLKILSLEELEEEIPPEKVRDAIKELYSIYEANCIDYNEGYTKGGMKE